MTFKQLQDGVLFGRFKESQRDPYVKMWLNVRMARIWTAFEWAFKIAEPTAVGTTTGNRYLGPAAAIGGVMPAAFGEMRSLADDNLAELAELEEAVFNRSYLYGRVKGVTGRPEAFTVVNRKVILGPVPDASYTFYLAYKRLMCHDDGAGNPVAGVMSADADKPFWPDEHHEVLIIGAQALGLKLVNDPAWYSLEQQHDDLVAGMLADGLLHDTLSRPRQPGRDPL